MSYIWIWFLFWYSAFTAHAICKLTCYCVILFQLSFPCFQKSGQTPRSTIISKQRMNNFTSWLQRDHNFSVFSFLLKFYNICITMMVTTWHHFSRFYEKLYIVTMSHSNLPRTTITKLCAFVEGPVPSNWHRNFRYDAQLVKKSWRHPLS